MACSADARRRGHAGSVANIRDPAAHTAWHERQLHGDY
jgi:hypothetical protein